MLPLSATDERTVLHRRRKGSVSALQRRMWRTYSRRTIFVVSAALLLPICLFAFLAFRHERSSSLLKDLGQDLTPGNRHPAQESSSMQSNFNISTSAEKLSLGLILLPDLYTLRLFSPTACRLQGSFQKLVVIIPTIQEPIQISENCQLNAVPLTPSTALWQPVSLRVVNESKPAFFLTCYDADQVPVSRAVFEHFSSVTTVIQLPCRDLEYSEWLGTLEPRELVGKHAPLTLPQYLAVLNFLADWHKPRIELSVITNDRPHSLVRLLRSLNNSIYFGDSPTLHINLEQTADFTTRELVQDFTWPFGEMHVRHRVIHGGLLPAVVESWFPQDNHTYGVLLEDDVEVSPLFYAWLKMALLRYRYGSTGNISPTLFGISLYQQRSLELLPAGRRAFNVPAILSESGIEDVHTPYLSQIPCSWGAVFFPEHWKEFHDYLVVRMSELTHDISEVIVPEVRSNSWRRSWKKYFIELVYLRGYVMLYPNYPGNLSLSTNHLEIGSHVRQLPEHILAQRKELFTPPLMPLSPPSANLLQLPHGQLPEWSRLPIIDLTGILTTEIDIIRTGMERRVEVSGCSPNTAQGHTYDARELLCGDYYERDGPLY